MWAPKVYQMDFKRNTAELRMLDNLRPEPRLNDGGHVNNDQTTKQNTKKKISKANEASIEVNPQKRSRALPSESHNQKISPIGTYSPVVAIQCLSWCPSILQGAVLASGMGCGLVRIDLVEGGWNGESMRFGSMERLLEASVDIDSADPAAEEEDFMD